MCVLISLSVPFPGKVVLMSQKEYAGLNSESEEVYVVIKVTDNDESEFESIAHLEILLVGHGPIDIPLSMKQFLWRWYEVNSSHSSSLQFWTVAIEISFRLSVCI